MAPTGSAQRPSPKIETRKPAAAERVLRMAASVGRVRERLFFYSIALKLANYLAWAVLRAATMPVAPNRVEKMTNDAGSGAALAESSPTASISNWPGPV